MAIGIRSVTTNTVLFPTTTGTVTTSESPSATQVGDLVVVINAGNWDTLANMQTPAATGTPTLTAITDATADAGTDSGHIKSYWYVANTGGAQTITAAYTGDAFSDKLLVAYVLTGADTTTPIDVAGNTATAATADPWVLSSISPTTADAYLIAHVNRGGSGALSAPGIAHPGTMTERYDISTNMEACGATEQLSSSGATGTRTFDIDNVGPRPWAGVMIALRTATVAQFPERELVQRYGMLRDWRLVYG